MNKKEIQMLKLLEIKLVCVFCKQKITDNNFGAIFGNPLQLTCNNTYCLLRRI